MNSQQIKFIQIDVGGYCHIHRHFIQYCAYRSISFKRISNNPFLLIQIFQYQLSFIYNTYCFIPREIMNDKVLLLYESVIWGSEFFINSNMLRRFPKLNLLLGLIFLS